MPGVDALMVVVPADKPLTSPAPNSAWRYRKPGALPRDSPLAGIRALPRLHCLKSVTISELASGVDVVTLIVPLPPACSVTPPAGDRMIVGAGGVMVNEAVSETCNHVD